MIMHLYHLYVVAIFIYLASAAIPKELCEKCVLAQQCPQFVRLSQEAQLSWMENYPCGTSQRSDGRSGFASIGKIVCCSDNLWKNYESSYKPVQANFNNFNTNNAPFTNLHNDSKLSNNNKNIGSEATELNDGIEWKPDRTQNYNNKNYWAENNQRQGNNSTTGNNNTLNENRWNNKQRYWNDRPDREWNFGNQNNNNNNGRENRQNENDYGSNQRPPFGNPRQPENNFNNQDPGRNRNNFNNNNSNTLYPDNSNNNQGNSGSGRCDRLTSFPPDPQSNCCGREVTDDDRITDQNAQNYYPPEITGRWAMPPYLQPGDFWSFRDQKQNQLEANFDENNGTVDIEKRISGGRVTQLYQYPWTVHLLIAINYGNNRQGNFNCGGSLISAKYVLSAGHCVYDIEALYTNVEVYLAEYDTRTFPRDCKISNNGRQCVENIVMYSEDIIIHPQYDSNSLHNDVSLIRLKGTAPYTEYIRPICLPSINIDRPEFSNLQFEVAGWGRNGPYKSDIKQSTFIHLVNQNECKRFYPTLTPQHLCAAGYSGEDTCKGDSGGPLMTLYRGRYYVTGIVSGKRRDAPCGTAVPSLYTNVYYYLDWIRNNIKN